MSSESAGVTGFDEDRAIRIFPLPLEKHAALVHIPLTQDGSSIPTFIQPEWGGVQVFYGDYYAILRDGEVVYGSAKEQWEAMHTQLLPGVWVKTGVPVAYQATEPTKIVTLIPTEDGAIGSVREAVFVVQPGDWIVRQPGGEIQHIKAAKFEKLYFPPEVVTQVGLDKLSDRAFHEWVLEAVQFGYAEVPSLA